MDNKRLNKWLETVMDLYLQGVLSAQEVGQISCRAVEAAYLDD